MKRTPHLHKKRRLEAAAKEKRQAKLERRHPAKPPEPPKEEPS